MNYLHERKCTTSQYIKLAEKPADYMWNEQAEQLYGCTTVHLAASLTTYCTAEDRYEHADYCYKRVRERLARRPRMPRSSP